MSAQSGVPTPSGVILLDKPPGVTSFQALSAIKKKLSSGRVGHAGTLDRFAQGLLIAAAGKYTRLVRLFTAEEKEYQAWCVFGRGTDTLDPEGALTGEGPVPAEDELLASLAKFRGRIWQRPPAFSAVHVAGERAYRYARRSVPVEPPPRPVEISRLELESYLPPRALLRVVCSKGTYIRSLARDIGKELGTFAFLETLTRVRIGAFLRDEAVAPVDFDPERHMLGPKDFIGRLSGIGRAILQPGREMHLSRGGKLSDSLFTAPLKPGLNAVWGESGGFLGIVNRTEQGINYEMSLAQ